MTDAATDGGTADDQVTDRGTAENAPAKASSGGSRSIIRSSYGKMFRSSDSLLLRAYAVVSALVGIFMVLLVILAMPLWIAETEGSTATNMIGRALLPLVVLFLLFPLTGPVLYAAKNHRKERDGRRNDALLGSAGFVFLLSLYLSLVISAPEGFRSDPPTVIAPVIEFFYALPPLAALAPPIVSAVAIFVVQRLIWR